MVPSSAANATGSVESDLVPTASPLDRQPQTASPGVPWAVVLSIVVYAGLALAIYFPTWPGDPNRIPQCACADAGLNTWFLAFTSHAVAHGQNLFYTSLLNHPVGVNLTYNTQMPLLGLITTPLTLIAGPVSSLNLLMWLAFPLSASSMFLVLRRWTVWTPSAFAGGLVYGFSPYMVGQSTAHLHLIFVPLPPVIVLAAYELFVRRTGSAPKWGVALGLLAAGQFLISSEVLVTTGLVVVIGLLILAVARPAQVSTSLQFAWRGLVWALAVMVAILAYPTWVYFTGPEHYTASSGAGGTSLLRSDLLGPVVPTSAERLAPSSWSAVGDRLTILGDRSENGSYLGVPLLLLLGYLGVRTWRNRWFRFAAAMAGVTFVLSLGPSLSIDGHSTGFPLPGAVLEHIPLVNQMVPSRISMLTALFVGLMVALGIDQLYDTSSVGTSPKRVNGHAAEPGHGFGRVQLAAVLVVGGLAVLALIPRWPNPNVPTATPPYFTSDAVHRIRPGAVAITYPFAAPLYAQPMVWQAVTGMRFSLIGGYALIPDAHGVPELFPSLLTPVSVEDYLINQVGGIPFYNSAPVADNGTLVNEIRGFIRRYRVGVVLVDTGAVNSGEVTRLYSRVLGVSPVNSGGIDAWYDVQRAPGLRVPAP
jgi:hypothetical protein